MSGGSLDYVYGRVEEANADLCRHDLTQTQKAFARHLVKVAKALHDIEWVLSGDYGDGDDTKAIMECIGKSDIIDTAIENAEKAMMELQKAVEIAKVAK